MSKTMKMITVIGVGLALLLLSACGGTATPTSAPTVDLNAHSTEVASTVWAQVTRDLALTPSVTLIPSPSATLEPSPTSGQTATASPNPQATLPGGTPATPGTPTNDQAEWVSQTVADGTVFGPGETFIITWQLKNVGTSTWTVNYLLRFFTGNAFGAPQEIFLDREVAPGDTVDIAIPMTAPTTPGEYRSDWVMANELRANFNQPVYLEIVVARPATATQTATTAPTDTATPTTEATP